MNKKEVNVSLGRLFPAARVIYALSERFFYFSSVAIRFTKNKK